MMRADDVLDILTWLATAGIPVRLDGGWGIDALVGQQTWSHDDLDVIIALPHAQHAHQVLHVYHFVRIEDEFPTRLVLRDPADRRVMSTQ